MPLDRVRAVASHEFHTQRTGAPLLVLLVVLLAATSSINPVPMIPGADGARDGVRAVANSQHALSASLAIGAIFAYPFFVALMAGFAVTRDREQGMDELLRSTPLTNREYIAGKFAGVLGALGVVIILHVGMIMAFRELAPGGSPQGPFHLSAYLVAALLFVVPLVVWVAGMSFAVGALARRPLAVYAVPTLLFVVTITVFWRWRPVGLDPALEGLLVIADPTGLRWLSHYLFAVDRGVPYYNSAPLAFDLLGVTGRVVTVLLPCLAVALVPSRMGGRDAGRVAGRGRSTGEGADAVRTTPSFRGLADLVMTRRAPGAIQGTVTILAAELRELSRQPTLYLFGLLLIALVAEVGRGGLDPLGGASVVSTGSVAVQVMPTLTMLLTLYLLFIVVETLYRDQVTGFEAIAFSTPISTGALLAGKVLAAFVVTGGLVACCMASAAAVVLAQPTGRFEPWPLVIVFVGVLGPTLLLWGTFVAAVMAVTRQRTTALAIGLATLLVTLVQFLAGSASWVTNWPVLGALHWTDFGTFPLDDEALFLNRVLALSVAALLVVVARRAFARTERDRRASAARRMPRRVALTMARVSPLLLLPAATGGLLAIRVHDGFEGPVAAEYADAYRRVNQPTWGTVEPPRIRHAELDVTLDPARRQLTVEGTYHLVHLGDGSLRALPFTIPRAFGDVAWTVDGQPARSSATVGMQAVQLTRPMQRGDSMHVGFRYVATVPLGYSRNGGGALGYVLPASVVLSTHRGDFLPQPGFDPGIGGTGPADSDSSESAPAGFNHGAAFTSTLTVRAPNELTVVGTGTLTASRTEEGRAVTTWRAEYPVSVVSIVAGRYDVVEDSGAAVYALASDADRAPAILSTLATARRRYTEWFTRAPWPQLRLTEVPDLVADATSYPTTILLTERLGFGAAPEAYRGLPFAVVAHETAHQWWGHLVHAGTGPGTGLLVEGMADYATLLLYDAEVGAVERRRYARYLEQEYLDRRDSRDEHPVLDAIDQRAGDATVVQHKGAWVMWMLRQEVGDARMRQGVRRFVEDSRERGGEATPDALLRTLRAVSLDTLAFDRFRRQWLSTVVLPEYQLHDARCAPAEVGWRCHVQLLNAGTGLAAIDVEARCDSESRCGGVRRVSVPAGDTVSLEWTQAARPTRLVVDPDVQVLQRKRAQASLDLSWPNTALRSASRRVAKSTAPATLARVESGR